MGGQFEPPATSSRIPTPIHPKPCACNQQPAWASIIDFLDAAPRALRSVRAKVPLHGEEPGLWNTGPAIRSMDPRPNPDFMRRAIALASENVRSGRGGPFGAVVVRDGVILAEGVNQVTAMNDPTAHAEVTAIRAACASLRAFALAGSELYTSCEPCPMCFAAVHWARMDRIWFGNTSDDAARADFDDAHLYRQLTLPRQQRAIPSVNLLRDEAWESFHLWQQSSLKSLY
jgi:guanine deaminase